MEHVLTKNKLPGHFDHLTRGPQNDRCPADFSGNSLQIHVASHSEDPTQQLADVITRLELEHARLQTTLDNIPVGVIVADAPSGKIVMGNAEVERILRHPILLSTDIDAYTDWVGFHADGRRVLGREWPLARALNGTTVHGEQFLYQRGDGTTAWIQVSAAPVYDRDKRITGGVVTIHDIDFQRRASEATRNSERRFRAIFEQAHNFFVILNPEGIIVDANEAALRISGSGRRGLLGHLFWESAWCRNADDEQQRLKHAVEEAMQGHAFRGEMRFVSADGNSKVLDLSLSAVRNESGEIAFIIVSGLDITERRQAEELLRLWGREKLAARIANSLAHEINNPLEILTNCLYLMQTAPSHPNNEAHLSSALEALNRMTAISGELLAVFTGRKINHDYADQIMGRKSELDLLFGVLENMSEAVMACDETGKIKFVNHAARQLFGTPHLKEPKAGCAVTLGVFHPPGDDLFSDDELPLVRALHGETVRDVELIIKSASGRKWRVSADANPVLSEDRSLIGAYVMCRIKDGW
jgi:PAS domain S-box-containing protein